MRKWLLFVCSVLAIPLFSYRVYAQFTEPHTYDNTPVGLNQIELAYGYAQANASLDISLVGEGEKFNVNQGSISYPRYFGLVHRLGWVEATLPIAGLGGSVSGTRLHGSVTGAGDSGYMLAMLLKGGPGLNVEQFENYKPTTIVGLSLTMTAPTGLYNSNKVLNLGSDR